jgi:hypothetical protein
MQVLAMAKSRGRRATAKKRQLQKKAARRPRQ